MENSTEKIERLYREIELENNKINDCKHVFADSIYDPEIERVGYGYKQVAHGSDVWPEPEGYENKEIARWSRKCKICGHKQYTKKQVPVIKEYKPDFGV